MLGRGCTWGGAGWISPSESAPVVGPQAIRQALYSLGGCRAAVPAAGARSGLYRWLLQAIRYCNSAAAARGLRAVADSAALLSSSTTSSSAPDWLPA